jgi:nucleoside-diphosphate-sugar epimerase
MHTTARVLLDQIGGVPTSKTLQKKMPAVLIIGGLYPTARHLIQYLVENGLAHPIRVVDKSIPQLAFLSPQHEAAFQQVEFIQSCMLTPALAKQVLYKDGVVWDCIFCFTLEGKLGQPEQAYDLGKRQPTLHAAEYALLHGSILTYQSTAAAYVHLGGDLLATEETPCLKPKKGHALKCTLKTEEELRAMDGLKLVVIRETAPFGTDFIYGFSTVFVLGRLFKEQGESMHHYMHPKQRLTATHIRDIARAYWHVFAKYSGLGKRVCLYNVASHIITEGQLLQLVTGYYDIPLKRWNPITAKLAGILVVTLLECLDVCRRYLE